MYLFIHLFTYLFVYIWIWLRPGSPPPVPPMVSRHLVSPPSLWNSLGLKLVCGMVGWFVLGLVSMVVLVIIPPPTLRTVGVVSFGV